MDVFGVDRAPASCDGCGRDSVTAEMHRTGWTVRPPEAGFPGSYCASCAAALMALDLTIQCAACGREIVEESAETRGWRYWPTPFGGLHPMCPDCAPREISSR